MPEERNKMYLSTYCFRLFYVGWHLFPRLERFFQGKSLLDHTLRRDRALILFRKAIETIVKLLIPLVIFTVMIGVAKIIIDLRTVFRNPSIYSAFDIMITDILSIFVVIELLRSTIEYFEIHRFKITFIMDAVLVFILREVIIGIYQNKLDTMMIYALSLFLLVAGLLRNLAIYYSPDRRKEKKRWIEKKRD